MLQINVDVTSYTTNSVDFLLTPLKQVGMFSRPLNLVVLLLLLWLLLLALS